MPTATPTATPTARPTATPTPMPISSGSGDLYVYGYSTIAQSYNTYLGCVTCSEFSVQSVFNSFGSYGSEFSSTSINNQFSSWGSVFSTVSACNTFAINPPAVVDSDLIILGYWTKNTAKIGRITKSNWVSALSLLCAQ
jgi:hypothetical protein